MSTVLDVEGLSFGYAKNHDVVSGLSFSVEQGQIVGLIGPNGSGKSTMLKLVADFLSPRRGQIKICGAAHTLFAAKRSSIYLASNDYLPEFLTGLEYLNFIHQMYRLKPNKADIDHLFERYQIGGRENDLLEDYSHGMRKKVQLIAALLVARPLTMIDETANGIDIDAVYNLQSDIQDLAKQGAGVLLCSHDFTLLEKVSDRILFLRQGSAFSCIETRDILERCGSIDEYARQLLKINGQACLES